MRDKRTPKDVCGEAKYTLDPGLVNLYFYTLREPNTYKPYGFFLGFLTTLLLCISGFLSFAFFVVKSTKTKTKLNYALKVFHS